MLKNIFLKSNIKGLVFQNTRRFSGTPDLMHKKNYQGGYLESKFYEKDFLATSIEEIEFVRSPFYDLAEANKMSGDEALQMLDEIAMK